MATVRDRMLPVVERGRQLIQDFGLRQHQTFVVRSQWSEHIHLGTNTIDATEITPRPKIKQTGPNTAEASKITPEFSGGGWSLDDLLPPVESGLDRFFFLRGPSGNDVPYVCTRIESTGNFGFRLFLTRLGVAVPESDF